MSREHQPCALGRELGASHAHQPLAAFSFPSSCTKSGPATASSISTSPSTWSGKRKQPGVNVPPCSSSPDGSVPGNLFELDPRSPGRTSGLSGRSSLEPAGGWALSSYSPSPPNFAARPDSAGRWARSSCSCAERQKRMCPLPEDLSPEGRKGVDQSQPCVSSGDVETRAQPRSIRLHPSRHPGQSASSKLSPTWKEAGSLAGHAWRPPACVSQTPSPGHGERGRT